MPEHWEQKLDGMANTVGIALLSICYCVGNPVAMQYNITKQAHIV